MKNYQEQVLNVIKEAVRVAGSQKQLAEAVGTNRAKICKWLTGTSPTTKDFAGIADFIGAQLIFPGETPDLRTFARMLALEAEDAPAHHMERGLDSTTPESVLEYVAAKRHNQPDMLFHPDYLAKLGRSGTGRPHTDKHRRRSALPLPPRAVLRPAIRRKRTGQSHPLHHLIRAIAKPHARTGGGDEDTRPRRLGR